MREIDGTVAGVSSANEVPEPLTEADRQDAAALRCTSTADARCVLDDLRKSLSAARGLIYFPMSSAFSLLSPALYGQVLLPFLDN